MGSVLKKLVRETRTRATDANDNKDLLKDAKPKQRENIIKGRIKKLEKEIQKFKDNIQKNLDRINNATDEKRAIEISNKQKK